MVVLGGIFALLLRQLSWALLCEVGMITPPMGLNLFVIQGISGRPFTEVVKGVLPFFWLMLVCLLLLVLAPDLILALPRWLAP